MSKNDQNLLWTLIRKQWADFQGQESEQNRQPTGTYVIMTQMEEHGENLDWDGPVEKTKTLIPLAVDIPPNKWEIFLILFLLLFTFTHTTSL